MIQLATEPDLSRHLQPTDQFKVEEAFFERERDNLVKKHRGKIAVIHKETLVGICGTHDEAIRLSTSWGHWCMITPIEEYRVDFI